MYYSVLARAAREPSNRTGAAAVSMGTTGSTALVLVVLLLVLVPGTGGRGDQSSIIDSISTLVLVLVYWITNNKSTTSY